MLARHVPISRLTLDLANCARARSQGANFGYGLAGLTTKQNKDNFGHKSRERGAASGTGQDQVVPADAERPEGSVWRFACELP